MTAAATPPEDLKRKHDHEERELHAKEAPYRTTYDKLETGKYLTGELYVHNNLATKKRNNMYLKAGSKSLTFSIQRANGDVQFFLDNYQKKIVTVKLGPIRKNNQDPVQFDPRRDSFTLGSTVPASVFA